MSSTESEYAPLIYSMIQETRELELEIISLRYLLSTCMCDEYRQNLRDEIHTSTLPEFRDEPAYNQFVKEYLNGKDPFDARAYTRWMRKPGTRLY